MSDLTRKTFRLLAAAGFAVCGFAASAQAQVVIEIHPTADSYVDSAFPNSNFGLLPNLEVSGGALPGSDYRHAFLKFDLSSYKGAIATATLVLYGQHVSSSTAGGSEPDTAWGVYNNSWTELGITWNSQPAFGPAQSTTTVTSTPGPYFWDVTPFVKSSVSSTSRVISLAVSEALVPGGSQGYDLFGAGPRPVGPISAFPEPELLISPD